MPAITTRDGVEIFYKDWGSGRPIVFSHGWSLSADDWDTQLLFFLHHGYRVITHDRRGHGRSTQTADGHEMDHYADDLAALTAHLDVKNAVHVGHSTGGGEVARYLARHGESRVAKAALISAVPPLMVKTAANPHGLPKRCSMACRRNSPPIVRNSIATWRQGLSTATTGRARKPRRPSSRIGGARA
jgi:non-heme chloroperoxidase